MMSAATEHSSITNDKRAEWARSAVTAFVQNRDYRHFPDTVEGLPLNDDTLAEATQDLASNMMHYMETIGVSPIELMQCAIGRWAAERKNPDPRDNAQARVVLATTAPQTVWLASYDTAKHGKQTHVFASEEAAYEWKDEIASEETAGDIRGPLSGDDYFEKMEAEEREWFSVEMGEITGYSSTYHPQARIVFPSRQNQAVYVGVHDNKEGIAGVRVSMTSEPIQAWRDEIAREGWKEFDETIPSDERTTDAFFDMTSEVYFNTLSAEIEGAMGLPTVWTFEVTHDYTTTVQVFWNEADAYSALRREIEAHEDRHGTITSPHPEEDDGPAPTTADEILTAKAGWLCEQDDDFDHIAITEHLITERKS